MSLLSRLFRRAPSEWVTYGIGGYILLLIIQQYGWWSPLVIAGVLILGIVVFEGVARFYIERRK